MSGYVDAHHHIWRVQDLPWLSGPMIPRIFGPYESLQQRDYLAAEYAEAAAAHGFTQSVYTQANWPLVSPQERKKSATVIFALSSATISVCGNTAVPLPEA